MVFLPVDNQSGSAHLLTLDQMIHHNGDDYETSDHAEHKLKPPRIKKELDVRSVAESSQHVHWTSSHMQEQQRSDRMDMKGESSCDPIALVGVQGDDEDDDDGDDNDYEDFDALYYEDVREDDMDDDDVHYIDIGPEDDGDDDDDELHDYIEVNDFEEEDREDKNGESYDPDWNSQQENSVSKRSRVSNSPHQQIMKSPNKSSRGQTNLTKFSKQVPTGKSRLHARTSSITMNKQKVVTRQSPKPCHNYPGAPGPSSETHTDYLRCGKVASFKQDRTQATYDPPKAIAKPSVDTKKVEPMHFITSASTMSLEDLNVFAFDVYDDEGKQNVSASIDVDRKFRSDVNSMCPFCITNPYRCSSLGDFARHVKEAEHAEQSEIGMWKMACIKCTIDSKVRCQADQKLELQLLMVIGKVIQHLVMYHQSVAPIFIPRYHCSWCVYMTYSPLDVYLHARLKHRVKLTLSNRKARRPCPHCGKILSVRGLENHLRFIHGPPQKRKTTNCPICGKTFLDDLPYHKSNLRQHIRLTHTDEKPYLCSICSLQFRRR